MMRGDNCNDTDREKTATLEARLHVYKPLFAAAIEDRLARLPLPPVLLSLVKLFIVTPLVFASLLQKTPVTADRPWLALAAFIAFIGLDYLYGVIACRDEENPKFGRNLDRLTDYPLLLIIAWFSLSSLPSPLVVMKVLVDLLLLALYMMEKGSPRNRLRSGINYATLIAMIILHQGLGHRLVTAEPVSLLLVADVVFLSLAALYNLNVLQKRFIADALSGANLLCGVFSMYFAARQRLDFSLLFLMLGAAFDGFDGAAARKFGGTRWGVYSDDVADAVNYGIAPGAALFLTLRGTDGLVLGIFYTVFTLSRLVFFTLNKSESDPDFFCGVPSTMGGIITLCSLILFQKHPAMIGMMVGVVCVLMVSFDTNFRHLGRALGKDRRAFFGMPLLLIILIGGHKIFGLEGPVSLILLACLGYGCKPTATHMIRLISGKKTGEEKPQSETPGTPG